MMPIKVRYDESGKILLDGAINISNLTNYRIHKKLLQSEIDCDKIKTIQ